MSDKFDITIPEPQPHPRLENAPALTMEVLLNHVAERDDRYTKTARGIRAAVRLLDAYDQAEGVLTLPSEDKGLLKEALTAPTCGYPELVGNDGSRHAYGRAVLPFVEAVEDAVRHKGEPDAG